LIRTDVKNTIFSLKKKIIYSNMSALSFLLVYVSRTYDFAWFHNVVFTIILRNGSPVIYGDLKECINSDTYRKRSLSL